THHFLYFSLHSSLDFMVISVGHQQNCQYDQRENCLKSETIDYPMADTSEQEVECKSGIRPFLNPFWNGRNDQGQSAQYLEYYKCSPKIFGISQMADTFLGQFRLRGQCRHYSFEQENDGGRRPKYNLVFFHSDMVFMLMIPLNFWYYHECRENRIMISTQSWEQ